MTWTDLKKKRAVLDKTSLSIKANKSADGSLPRDNISQANHTVNSDVLSNTKYCRVTIDVTPCKYKKSKKSDKILIEQKNIYRKDFLL